jgi:hypothetical protein
MLGLAQSTTIFNRNFGSCKNTIKMDYGEIVSVGVDRGHCGGFGEQMMALQMP